MMDHHERERERGRTSRASSTSSLGREVRCACQFFQSDSLLPERRAMIHSRPSSRNTQATPITVISGTSQDAAPAGQRREHEYEPIGTPLVNPRTMTPVPTAPVVRIIDTDVMPVADSDDSIDLRGRFTPGPMLEGNDLILPLDGQIEDSAMETRELAGGGDTSEELESPQQLQDRLEERFFNAATPCTESKIDREVNASQVDSSAMEELPLRQGARGLPQRLRSQAGKLRSRLKSIQRPTFSLSIDRLRSAKTKSPSTKSRGSSERVKSTSDKRSTTSERAKNVSSENKPPRTTDKRTRLDRIRSSLPDRPRISLPDRPKFNFPDRSKFRLPERPKFNIKKPNVRFPTLGKSRRAPSLGEVQRQRSDESSTGSRRNVFDFSTYPRLFDRKSKNRQEYATSSPKESRSESIESSTLPRAKKTAPLGSRWSQKFTDIKFADDEENDLGSKTLIERSKPWRRPSLEEPRLSLRAQESIEEPESLPWEDSGERRRNQQIEELPYEHEEEEIEREEEIHRGRGLKLTRGTSDESYDDEPPAIDPRLYGAPDVGLDDRELEVEEIEDTEDSMKDREAYRATFMSVDPRYYKRHKANENEPEIDELEGDDDEPLSSGMEEDVSARSDREQQQSSGSSCDRRRRGVIEEIDSDEFFIREKGISQDDMNVGRYLTKEIRDALRTPENALAHEIVMVAPKPPQRPVRRRSMRKQKETSVESYDAVAPTRPKRDNQRMSVEADYEYEDDPYPDNADNSISESRHRVVYHADSAPIDLARIEPLDDIVVVKPMRRKSKSSLRSQSLRRSESLAPQPEETTKETAVKPSVPPRRRKRLRGVESIDTAEHPARVNGIDSCNGRHSPISIELHIEEKVKTPAPKKPQRAASRETLKSLASIKYDREESAPPIPPKRLSHSRGASVVPDDDRTSHGAESIPEIDYTEDDIPQDDNDSRLDYPGYAMIEKRDKPPRPPPPRKRKDEKFATTPRPGKTPTRPQRAYSTLKPARSRTPSEVTTPTLRDDIDVTAYEELDSDDEDERRLKSGFVVNKIQGRPLPAPPRPPRSRRERHNDETEGGDEIRESSPGMSEAFASTQTDPLPDDMVIEEEVTQAKLIVSPSRSGSQVLVSMERIPSPTMMNLSMSGTRSFSQGPSTMERVPDPSGMQYAKSTEFTSEPPERTASQTFSRLRRTPSPVRRATAPIVPPLPAQKSFYRDEPTTDFDSPERGKSRSRSPSLPRDINRKDDDYQTEMETRLQSSLSDRIRLENELEQVRSLRSAIFANESIKIASLEVTDLRVENLNVTTLEAQKLTASEIDALVINATEISNKSETSEQNVNLQPTLLRELVAIRSQLELVNSSQEASTESTVDLVKRERRKEGGNLREITHSSQQPVHLQLDQVSRTMETRAIFSSIGSSRESSPQPAITSVHAEAIDPSKKVESVMKDESTKPETRSSSRSRSSSPGGMGSPTRLRQTASPVKSLPPVISVTPDTPDSIQDRVVSSEGMTPQRAILSYVREEELSNESLRELSQRPSSPSIPSVPPPSFQPSLISGDSRFIAFSASQVPPEFFSLASSPTTTRNIEQEPGIVDLGQQLLRAVRIASKRAMRHFVGYIVNRIGQEETDTKMREIELALCALLLIIAGLLIVCFGGPRTITHHHHWDYFNPPRM